MIFWLATNSTPVQVTNPTSAAGLTTPDLLVILGIIITIGLALVSAIGILVLRQFTGLDARIAEIKADSASDLSQMKQDNTNALNAIWRELGLLRSRLFNEPNTPVGPNAPH